MSIRIVDDEPELRLTRAEYDRLLYEYNQCMMFYVNPPSFESWARQRMQEPKVTLLQETLGSKCGLP